MGPVCGSSECGNKKLCHYCHEEVKNHPWIPVGACRPAAAPKKCTTPTALFGRDNVREAPPANDLPPEVFTAIPLTSVEVSVIKATAKPEVAEEHLSVSNKDSKSDGAVAEHNDDVAADNDNISLNAGRAACAAP